MKKLVILSLILSSILSVNAESLFSLNASQSSVIEPKALFSSVRARGIGDLVSIVIDEAPAMTDIGTYSTQKQSSLAENLTRAFNTIFSANLKGALNGTEGNLNVTGQTQLARTLSLTDIVVAQVVQVLPNGNLLVQGKKDVHADTEVRGIEKSLSFVRAHRLHLVQPIEPSGRSRNHRHTGSETLHIIVESRRRRCKLNCHIRAFETFRTNLFRIIDIHNRDNLMPSAQRDLLDGLPHLPVTNQCYFHLYCSFSISKR